MWNQLPHGLIAGMNATGLNFTLPKQTMIGALMEYISTPNSKFQPMNANFGILPELEEKIKNKQERYQALAKRALQNIPMI